MNGESEILAGRKEVELFLEEERVGTQIDVLLARYQSFHDLLDLGVHQGFATGNGHHRSAALVHRLEALLGRKIHFEDMGWVLNLAATSAGQVATEQRFQHQHQRILTTSVELLLQNIRRNSPHL